MTNYIVTSNDPGKMGGSKAKEDIVKFLKEEGYASFWVNPYQPNKLAKFWYTYSHLMNFLKKSEIDNLIMQYPIPSRYMVDKFVNKLKETKKTNFIIWIHDIQGLQSSDNDSATWEIELFNNADILVVHNEKMKQWLLQNGVNTRMIVLEIFDYDNPQTVQKQHEYEKTVCFAGNLFKSVFLTELNTKNKVYVFGPNMPEKHSANTIYSGQYSPEELSQHLTQNFGLIWDGPSLTTCEGTFGHYLLFNNPHKTSLYISSGVPIIIWEKAALADFVLQNNIGIVIDDLSRLDQVLDSVSAESYNLMKKNIDKMAVKLRTGYYTKEVIKKIDMQ